MITSITSRSRPGQPTLGALSAHRLVVRAARPFLRPQPASVSGPPRVTFLLLNAYGMSGAIRANLNLAGRLALRHDVEVVSVIRSRRKPSFAFPPGVRVTAVDDQRPRPLGGWRGLLRGVLRRFKSRLVHPEDLRYATATLWTDLLLVRRLRRLTAGPVITNRPSLNPLGAQLARPGVAVFAHEERDLRMRGQEIRERMQRGYAGLEALAVLTDSDRAAYDALLGGTTRVVTIPTAAIELPGPPSDLSHPIVLAAAG